MTVVAKVTVSYKYPKNTLLTKSRYILFVFTDPTDVDRVVSNFREGWEELLQDEDFVTDCSARNT